MSDVQFICPITQEQIRTICELTSCGHYFEAGALFQLVVHAERAGEFLRCPYCRTDFQMSNIYFSRSLQNYIDQLRPKSVDASTQTEDVPEVAEPMEIDLPTAPETLRGIHSFRSVNLEDSLFNPASYTEPEPVIINLNARFNRKYAQPIPIFKFVYQSTLKIQDVAELLAKSGYLVYDIFYAQDPKPVPCLNIFTLYSAARRIDGAPVNFSLLK